MLNLRGLSIVAIRRVPYQIRPMEKLDRAAFARRGEPWRGGLVQAGRGRRVGSL
jgi:hypothetical protein